MESLCVEILNFMHICKVHAGSSEHSAFIDFLKLIYYILIFLIILGASYYLTRYIAKKSSNKNRLIRLIETFSLGHDKNIHIISLGEKFFLISSTQKEINLIDKFSKEEFENLMSFQKEIKEEEKQGFNSFIDYSDYEKANDYKSGIKKIIQKLKYFVRGSRTDD